MTTLQGVDCSFDPLTADEAFDLKHAGVEVFMQCLLAQPASGPVQPAPRVTNLRNALNAGMYILGYAVLPYAATSQDGFDMAGKARSGVPQDIWDRLLCVETDVELPMQPEAIRSMVDSFVGLEKPGVVYTNFNTWVNVLSNPMGFGDCLLHNALWDLDPNISFGSRKFGPWTIQQVIAEQWSGGTYVQGQFADRNTFVRELLLPAAAPPDPCGLPKLRVQSLEEVATAMVKGDYKTGVRWGRYLGG